MNERTLEKGIRQVYTRGDIDKWIKYGVSNGYVEQGNKKELYKWLSILKDVEIIL